MRKKLMRVWYRTDADETSVGMFSAPFPWREGNQIVGVDWSTPGEVWITWLVNAE